MSSTYSSRNLQVVAIAYLTSDTDPSLERISPAYAVHIKSKGLHGQLTELETLHPGQRYTHAWNSFESGSEEHQQALQVLGFSGGEALRKLREPFDLDALAAQAQLIKC